MFDPMSVALTRVNGETLNTFIFSDPDAIPPNREHFNESGNYPDAEELPEDCQNNEDLLQVKFIRSEVQKVVPLGDEVELTVTGNLLNGATFQGIETIEIFELILVSLNTSIVILISLLT